MSLMELMVALTVLSLISAAAFSNIGHWLSQSRRVAEDAAFWRAAPSVQLALSELTSGAIDPEHRRMSRTQANFRTLTPRLASTPITARLRIDTEDGASRLIFSAPELDEGESVLMSARAPLRFSSSPGNRLTLEMRQDQSWTPIASAEFVADAPLVCAFDLISRSCR